MNNRHLLKYYPVSFHPLTRYNIIMELQQLVSDRRSDILRIATQYGARNVRVFGSTARGDTHAGSDIDFLVDLDADRSLFDLGGMLSDLQGLLNCRVDVVTEKGLRSRFRDRVLKEAFLI